MRGGCGGMAVDVFVTVSRGDCLWKVSAASVELSLQPSSKQRAIQFLSVSLSTHAEDTRGLAAAPPETFKCFMVVWFFCVSSRSGIIPGASLVK